MNEPEDLCDRFGNSSYYEENFRGLDRTGIKENFESLDRHKGKSSTTDSYEISRQNFLKLLGQHKMVWQSTNGEYDLDVDVSRVYRQDRHEYIAFMRIQPRGFRADRTAPQGIEMRFHVLIGRVLFTCRSRTRTLARGQYITVAPKSTYSIRCCDTDQAAYLIFKIHEKNRTNAS